MNYKIIKDAIKVVELYKIGKCSPEISEELGFSKQWISVLFKRYREIVTNGLSSFKEINDWDEVKRGHKIAKKNRALPEDKFKRVFNKSKDVKVVAKKLNCCVSLAYRRRAELGLNRPKFDITKDDLIKLKKLLMSDEDIAEEFRISPITVQRKRFKYGIPTEYPIQSKRSRSSIKK